MEKSQVWHWFWRQTDEPVERRTEMRKLYKGMSINEGLDGGSGIHYSLKI